MTGMLAVGVLLIALGVVFLAVPLEQLQKVFRRMRSRIGTKIGGAVLVAPIFSFARIFTGIWFSSSPIQTSAASLAWENASS